MSMEQCVNSVQEHIKSLFDQLSAKIINEYLSININIDEEHKVPYELFSGIVYFTFKKNIHQLTFNMAKKIGCIVTMYNEQLFTTKVKFSFYSLIYFYNSFSIDKQNLKYYKHFTMNKKNRFEPTLFTLFNLNKTKKKFIFLYIESYFIFNNKKCLIKFLTDCGHIVYYIKHYLLHKLDTPYVCTCDYCKKNTASVKKHEIDNLITPLPTTLLSKICNAYL
jgi:hypothetical protein